MKDIDSFIDEITTNFSEIFIETFFLRFLTEFEKDELLNGSMLVTKKILLKIKRKLRNKLEDMGYNEQDIEKIVK